MLLKKRKMFKRLKFYSIDTKNNKEAIKKLEVNL